MHAPTPSGTPSPTIAAPPRAAAPSAACRRVDDATRQTRPPRLALATPEAEARRLRAGRAMLERLGARLAACAPREAAPTSSRHPAVAGASPAERTLRAPPPSGATR